MKTANTTLLLILFCVAFLLLGGCTEQMQTECPDQLQLDITVVDIDDVDITDEGVVRTLSLYVFDHNKLFLKRVDARVGESLRLYFPDQDILNIVSWGNLNNESMELPTLSVGTPMHQAVIRLLNNPSSQHSRAATRSIAMSPDDLFYSYDEISLKTGKQVSYKLKMNRTVSSMAITMRNLQSYANRYDEDYSLVVRETFNAIDFYGRLTGDKVGYAPKISFNDKKELLAPLFNMMPCDATGIIEIDIYHKDELITTIKSNSDGNPLRAEVGKVLNVLVDFKVNVSVEVSITPWGETKIWKEF